MDEQQLPEPHDFQPEPLPPVAGEPAATPPPAASGTSDGADSPGDFLGLGAELGGAAPPPPTAAGALGGPPLEPSPFGDDGAQPAPVAPDASDLAEGVDFDDDDEGSWLMSLDDVIGDRAGTDTIVPTPVAGADLPLSQQASWSEETAPKARARRVLVPLAGVALVAMVGWAGWRFVDLRGELTMQAPGPLDAGSAPQPRRVVPLDGPREGAGPATRQSIGKGPRPQPAGGATEAPGGRSAGAPPPRSRPADARGARVAYEPTVPPTPTIAPGVPFPPATDAPPAVESDAVTPSEPVAVARASDAAPAPIPETIPTPSPEQGPEPVATAQPVGSDAAESLAISDATRDRWRSLFGLGSEGRGSRRPRPRANPDERIIASSTGDRPASTEDGAEVAAVLPYGLDAAYIDGWSPPLDALHALDEDLDPSERPVEYVRKAGWRDLIGIWVGSDVPFAAIDEPERTLTPSIGFVAVHMKSGEIVEGVLTEVGGGHVWVQTTENGRLGLRHESFEAIDVLGVDGTSGRMVVESLNRVRVATAGGAVYGRLVTTDDERATVYTDAGARITVPRSQVELLGSDAAVRLNRG